MVPVFLINCGYISTVLSSSVGVLAFSPVLRKKKNNKKGKKMAGHSQCLANNISIASWNINGMKNRYMDKGNAPDFHKYISGQDIVCISETHVGEDYNLNVTGFHALSAKSRPICKSNSRYYGGMILLVREELRNGVQELHLCSY